MNEDKIGQNQLTYWEHREKLLIEALAEIRALREELDAVKARLTPPTCKVEQRPITINTPGLDYRYSLRGCIARFNKSPVANFREWPLGSAKIRRPIGS